MGSRKRAPGATRSASGPASQRPSTGAVRIALTERGRLTVGEVDPESGVSRQLALTVRQQVLGSGRVDQAALRGAVESMEAVVLVAEEDDRLGFPVDDMTRLLGEFAAGRTGLAAGGMHERAASLLSPESVCDPGHVSTGEEEQGRAIDLRRKAVGLGQEKEQQMARAEEPGTRAEDAWSGQLKVPDLPAQVVAPLGEVASAFAEISSLAPPDVGRLGPLLERIGVAVSEVVRPVLRAAAGSGEMPEKLVEVRITVEPLSGQDQPELRGTTPRGVRREEPLRREGHPIIEDLAALWDQRGSLLRDELVGRFQGILDRFHAAKSLGSYDLNRLATQWINRFASKNSIKMLFDGQAVTIYCANRGEAGFFLPRLAKGHSAAIKGAGSYEFPSLKAIAL